MVNLTSFAALDICIVSFLSSSTRETSRRKLFASQLLKFCTTSLGFALRMFSKSHLPQGLRRLSSRGVATRASQQRTRELLDKIIRVDHAGELGADKIYEGQLTVLGKTSVGPTIKHMQDQEKHHLATFERLIPEYRVRPTVLTPLWNIAGFALGAGTALLGKEAAMACTVAVETSIGEHYDNQLRALMKDDPEAHKELMQTIRTFRDEELEHLDTGLEHNAEQAPFYKSMSQAIKVGCTAAIWLSERI